MTRQSKGSIISTILLLLVSLPYHLSTSADEIWTQIEINIKDRKDTDVTECEKSLLRIIENIKYLNYTNEALGVSYNTGKSLYDVGYYESCGMISNLTYYLIRPIRTDLKSKFSFGLCLPKECNLHAADQLVAQNIINKHWLTHIANQTEHQPQDYLSHAVVLPEDPQLGTTGNLILIGFVLFAGLSLIRPMVVGFKGYVEEDIEESLLEGQSQTSDESFTLAGAANQIWKCFDIVETVKYLISSRKIDFSSISFIKIICGGVVLFSNEYIRRQMVGLNQNDKQSIERTKDSLSYNLVYFSAVALDVMFFLSGACSLVWLSQAHSKILGSPESRSIRGYLKFYLLSIIQRLLRLAPLVIICLIFYHNVIPGLLSGPYQHLFDTTYANYCHDTYYSSFSFFTNLSKGTKYCMGWSWFIFVDFQLFLILPLVVILMNMNLFVCGLFSLLLTITSLGGSFAIFGADDLSLVGPYSSSDQYQQFLDHYHSQPWGKVAFYILGAWVGYYSMKRQHSMKISLSEEANPLSLMTIDAETVANQNEVRKRANSSPLQMDLLDKVPQKQIVTAPRKEPAAVFWSWAVTLGWFSLAVATFAGGLAGFLEFSRHKDNWNSVVQVLYAIGIRVAIIGTLAGFVLNWETERARPSKSSKFSWLGLCSRFALGVYLWQGIIIEWGLSSTDVSQYYDGLLVFCYSMTDFSVLLVFVIPTTLFIEIPFKRLIHHFN